MSGKTIALDFDATLHPYSKGWVGPVPDDEPPVPGTREAVAEMRALGYRIAVFSCRALTQDGRDGIVRWCEKHGIEVDEVTALKPHAQVYVDDRALRFDGRWSHVMWCLREPDRLTPWNARAQATAGQIDPAKWASHPPRCFTCGGAVAEVTNTGHYTACGHLVPDAGDIECHCDENGA